jgi:hypothetical protein
LQLSAQTTLSINDTLLNSIEYYYAEGLVSFIVMLNVIMLSAVVPKTSEASLLNKSSCLAPALGVTIFIIVSDMFLITSSVVPLKSDLDVQEKHPC